MKKRFRHEGTINYNKQRRNYEGQVRYQKEDGTYTRKHFRGASREEVKKKIQQFLDGNPKQSQVYTVETWLEDWLKTKKLEVKIKTYERYRCTIYAHILPYIGTIPLKSLTTMKLQDYLTTLANRPSRLHRKLAPRTVNGVRRLLIGAFNDAVNFDVLQKNPMLGTKPLRVERTEMHILTKKKAAKLLQVAKSDNMISWIIIAIALGTGMRIGEIFGLRWQRVDLVHKKILVSETVVHTNHTNIVQSTGKTAGSYRTIPISASLVSDLEVYHQWQADLKKMISGYHDQDFVIAKLNGDVLDPSNFSARTFKKYLKQAGITSEFRVHDLRHTHITWLLEAGVNIKVISQRAGHASTRITLDTYSHVMPSMQDAAVEALDKISDELQGIKESAMEYLVS